MDTFISAAILLILIAILCQHTESQLKAMLEGQEDELRSFDDIETSKL
jgi:hypothetical protein